MTVPSRPSGLVDKKFLFNGGLQVCWAHCSMAFVSASFDQVFVPVVLRHHVQFKYVGGPVVLPFKASANATVPASPCCCDEVPVS